MNLEEFNKIIEAFKAKVGTQKELLYEHAVIKGFHGIKHGALSIFNGTSGDSEKIASLGLEGVDGNFAVTLVIGWNEFKFIENPELCLELIERFIHIPQKQIA